MGTIVAANPADVSLEPAPFPREWVIEGAPTARAKTIARSEDGALQVVVWSCTPGRFRWEYGVDETVQILSGEVIVSGLANREWRLGPGDTAFFPAGSCAVWHVTEEVRKVAVCRRAPPKMFSLGLRVWQHAIRRAKLLAGRPQHSLAGTGALVAAWLIAG